MPAGSESDAALRRVSIVLVLGAIVTAIDLTIVNIGVDTLHRELHRGVGSIQWVITAYSLALAAVIPLTGWAARRFGARRAYLVSLTLFTLGSTLCGLCSTLEQLVVCRVLQGLGGGMIMPLGLIILADAAGPARLGRAMGLMNGAAMFGPMMGPVFGGLILAHLGWQWIFFVNVPLGVAGLALGWRHLPAARLDGPVRPLDGIGLGLLGVGIPAITYGLSTMASGTGVTRAGVVAPIAGGLVLVAIFVRHALRIEHPLLDVRLYTNRIFAAASATTFVLSAGLLGAMVLMPLYFQQVRGLGVLDAGLLMLPQGLGLMTTTPLAGRLVDRMAAGPLTMIGLAVTLIGTAPLAFAGAHTPLIFLMIAIYVRGAGIGMTFTPTMKAALGALQREQVPDASPQLNVAQRVGGSIGTALLAVALQRELPTSLHPDITRVAGAYDTAYRWALLGVFLAAVPGLVLLRAEGRVSTKTTKGPPRLDADPRGEVASR
jgi:EmrB/QacA subfamily drug resistance transporter